ncbi:aquaporin [Nocardia aurantia]|uniref:Aquaporin Z n=1 Tax=Nocardia aurantia TaxID=2585199 RepID=A0A7K0DL91_9NOCA|nr:aquaporin [Nocardia aurantia]MQY26555.1 Aquaporin Z [Nocardia aurantia]
MSPTAQEVVEEDVERRAVPLRRKLLAEGIGTFVLVFGGVGAWVLEGSHRIGSLGVAVAFGFTLLFLMYTIGPISGCHVNPAVTLGHLLLGRIGRSDAGFYVLAQLIGGFLSGAVIYAVANNLPSYDRSRDGLGANGWGGHSPAKSVVDGPLGNVTTNGYGLAATIIVEIILTALLVFVILASTDQLSDVPLAGLSIGTAYAVVTLVALPVDGASVNPVRSLAVAPYQGGAMGQVWAFILFPVLGGLLGALVYSLLFGRARNMAT